MAIIKASLFSPQVVPVGKSVSPKHWRSDRAGHPSLDDMFKNKTFDAAKSSMGQSQFEAWLKLNKIQ